MLDDHLKSAAYGSLFLWGIGVVGVAARIEHGGGAALPNPAIALNVDVAPVSGTTMVQSTAAYVAAPPYAPIAPTDSVRRLIRPDS